jgi:undecaprenyldiphospho-muramoylpentapeptide beta-N-acetylglucosaminyltransferase
VTSSFLLAGGGTAGHVNPLLATAAVLAARGHQVAALGTAEGLEQDLVPRAGLQLHIVPRVPMPRSITVEWFRLPGKLKAAVDAAARAIEATHADAVVGFGGFVSTPAYFAARRLGVPIVVHEGNVRPGIANRIGARLTRHVATTYPETPLKGATLTGLPVRAEIADMAAVLADDGSRKEAQEFARISLGFPADAPVLLVTGGSQGAASLNAATVESIERLAGHGVYVHHVTGRGKAAEAEAAKGGLSANLREHYRIDEYVHDMATAYAAAGAVMCRSGVGTVWEVTALGIPALYVPLPHGNGEQALNAGPVVEAGAATMIRDADLNAASMEQAVERMLLHKSTAVAMSQAARRVGVPDGADRLADVVEGAAR